MLTQRHSTTLPAYNFGTMSGGELDAFSTGATLFYAVFSLFSSEMIGYYIIKAYSKNFTQLISIEMSLGSDTPSSFGIFSAYPNGYAQTVPSNLTAIRFDEETFVYWLAFKVNSSMVMVSEANPGKMFTGLGFRYLSPCCKQQLHSRGHLLGTFDSIPQQ